VAAPAPAPGDQGWSQNPNQNQNPADPDAGWQRRIAPSPPRRSVLPVLIAVVLAVLIAGPGGYLAATLTSNDKDPKPEPSPVASSELPPFEANQRDANRAKFNSDLAAFAENWLPYVGGCISDTDPGNNRLQQGEKSRISCRAGGLGISFVLYTSIADRDAIRVHREKQNREGGALAPGVAAPSVKAGASGKSGNYVEYAFRDGTGKTIAGIWWDRQDLAVTAYVEAAWTNDLRDSWEPLREVWQRRS
jgi:hypothetical protein